MKILVIDGQGGRMGGLLIERLKEMEGFSGEITAVGTNSMATSAMLKAGADFGATGENPVVVNSRSADLIVGPIGMLGADSLLGEVTPAMAVAVGQSPAQKVLLPFNNCHYFVAGVRELSLQELIQEAVDLIVRLESGCLSA